MEGEKVETGLEFQMTKGELAEYWLFRVFFCIGNAAGWAS